MPVHLQGTKIGLLYGSIGLRRASRRAYADHRRLHERVLLNHMTSLDDGDVAAAISSGARISQNPTSALKLAKGTTQTGKWKALLDAGVPMALGTDAENVSNHQDICRSMQLAALLPRDQLREPNAVSAEQALEMATLGGATALWWDDEVGSLEAGKQADIVVIDTDNFDLRPLHNPVTNLVYGSTGHSVTVQPNRTAVRV